VLAGYEHLLAAGRRLQWDAETIDLSADAAALGALSNDAQRRVRTLLAGFWVAEHGVAEHLEEYVTVSDGMARRCLELQASDERRHARFFERVRAEVLDVDDVRGIAGAEIVALFERELPAVAAGLAAGSVALADAVGLYHLVLEAIVLSVGEAALVAEAAPLPGVAAGAARVQADERWHIGLGVQVLSDAGISPGGIEPLAERAARAWGAEIASDDRVRHALAAHRRRALMLRRSTVAGRV
jgi:ribonucleotide reductase beta subunit family protein with ferritin-like domain